MLGQRARFERYAAHLLFTLAAGAHIDPDRAERFGKQVNDVYRNPFVKRVKQPETAEEIKQHIIHRLEEALQWT